jgi:hypothetical protein
MFLGINFLANRPGKLQVLFFRTYKIVAKLATPISFKSKNMKINIGQLVASREVHHQMSKCALFSQFVNSSLSRHLSGDWGDCCSEDKQANERALNGSDRLFSVYINEDEKIWIITEWDRSVTTILFPHEY